MASLAQCERSARGPVVINDRVLRTVVSINPTMAAGQSLAELKRRLESPGLAHGANPPSAVDAEKVTQLAESLRCFLQTKQEQGAARRRDLEAQAKAVQRELAELGHQVQLQLATFLSLLNSDVLRRLGPQVFERNRTLCTELGIEPEQVLATLHQ